MKGDLSIPWKISRFQQGEKTGAYVDENRKSRARLRVKGFQEFAESKASEPTVQLQITGMCLDVIAYRKWNFRVMDVTRAFF